MSNQIEQQRLISHQVAPATFEATLKNASMRIKQQGPTGHYSVEQKLELLLQLRDFDFGRYLLQNQGVNGYWTHYMLTHPWFGKKTGTNNHHEPLSILENFILNRAPLMLAAQQRLDISLKEIQTHVKNSAKLASIPSGMMGEFLYLDFTNITDIKLVGIDYDPDTHKDAQVLAAQRGLTHFLQLEQQDAWQLSYMNEFDLIASNGLTIYVADGEKITELFRGFFSALKPGGKLVTGFMTYPPNQTERCEWDMSKINTEDLLLQKVIFGDVLAGRWQHPRSSEETLQRLGFAGFQDIQITYDEARMFPSVVAYKPS